MHNSVAGAETPIIEPEEVGDVAAGLLDASETGNLIFIARDEVRAAKISQALSAMAPGTTMVFCPGSDALPGEDAPPSPSNAGQRVSALRRLRAATLDAASSKILLITTAEATARLYPPPRAFDIAPPVLHTNEPCELDRLAAKLLEIGYVSDDRVDEPGEIGLRGQVLDVFPADAGEPYRIEVQDGLIASIRSYDPATQLASGERHLLEVGRAQEPEMGHGVPLLEHLPGAAIVFDRGADERRKRYLRLAADAGRRQPKRALRDFCSGECWSLASANHTIAAIGDKVGEPPPRFVEQKNPARAFVTFARGELQAGKTLAFLGTARDLRFLRRRVEKLLKAIPFSAASWEDVTSAKPGSILSLEVPLTRGFRSRDVVAVAAGDLLGSRAQRGDEQDGTVDFDHFRIGEIKVGDVIVHEDHGLAVVAGLESLPTGEDAIVLRFAGEARRLVSASQAHRIWRYGAEEGSVSLDKLDGSSWAKRREDVDQTIAESARRLVALAKERQRETAPIIEPDAAAYERFSASFAFTETVDQMRAIDAVRSDLVSGKPMDRLVIGDVGYGKTEVALRAAAMAAFAGKQVALAAPTTVLVRQHLETFKDRFAEAGIGVAGLSRLSTPAERRKVIAGLKDGSVQVVIGTAAVAGKEVAYKDLGLVIVDEEQRFGAAEKAKLRGLGAKHVLTLSATPIPRTLQHALIGIQQLSVIATPPARRQPIRTSVSQFDEQLVRTALLRERSRGGQSFVVVPRIEDMKGMAERLHALVPELQFQAAHGKMAASEIDQAMISFASGDGDVLLATNIIEAGLDVPRANTMIVWKADRFGLSQLHQLRGRVGRGARRGQIYLVTEAGAKIAPRTMSRLQTLQAFDRLGAGFAISARDLDMRGAGDLLGEEQAGHVKLIGVDLYQHLLERALRNVSGDAVADWTPEVNLGASGRFPDGWIPDEDIRIGLYGRLARLRDKRELDDFEDELADRFGEPPLEAHHLLAQRRIQHMAKAAEVERLDAGPAAVALSFRHGAVPAARQSELLKRNGRWLFKGAFEDEAVRTSQAEELLTDLAAG